MKKLIAHLVAVYPPYESGMGDAVYYLHQELLKLGIDSDVLTVEWKKDMSSRAQTRDPDKNKKTKRFFGRLRMTFFLIFSFLFWIPGQARNDKERSDVIRLKPWFRYGNAVLVPQLLWKIRNYDILHVQYAFFGGIEFALLAKWLGFFKGKIILQYQNDVIGKGIVNPIAWMDEKIFFKHLLRAADKILALSEYHYKDSRLFKYHELIKEKIVFFPNGFDGERFIPREKDHEQMEWLGFTENTVVVAHTSALDRAHYFKGVEDLIDAFQKLISLSAYQLISFHLLIIGGGDMQAQYEARAQQKLQPGTYTFTGKITNSELPQYLNLCDFFVLPSYEVESFGIVVAEALAMEKPVIVSDLPALKGLWGDQPFSRVFRRRNVGDLAEKIAELTSLAVILTTEGRKNPGVSRRDSNAPKAGPFTPFHSIQGDKKKTLAEMGKQGREYVLQRYTWQSLAKRLVEISENI